MISKAWATMRTARSFLPLLRPFIIKLCTESCRFQNDWILDRHIAPIYQSLDNGHLGFLELFLSITAGRVWEIDSMADLDVVSQGDILHIDTITRVSLAVCQGMRSILLTPLFPTFQRA
jgi:hypothetical protein